MINPDKFNALLPYLLPMKSAQLNAIVAAIKAAPMKHPESAFVYTCAAVDVLPSVIGKTDGKLYLRFDDIVTVLERAHEFGNC